MGKPFRVEFKNGEWTPFKPGGSNPIPQEPRPSTTSLRDVIEIHKLPDGSRYLTVLNSYNCYEIKKNLKFFLLYDTNGKEWVPCKGNTLNNPCDKMSECPETEIPAEAVIAIFEGSYWVRIGGRWYKIG